MMELRYALKNLIKAIKNKPLSFVLTEVYILVSVLALFFCYGIAGNYELLMRQSDAAYEEKCVYIQFNEDIYTDGSSASLAEVNEFLAGLQAVTQLDMKIVSSYILVGGNVIDISYGFDGGAFTYPEYKADNFSRNNWLMSGRYFTEEEFKQGKKVVVIPDIIQYGDLYSYDSERNSIILDGEEYSVIGILDCPFIDLPVTSVKEETIVQDMLIEMKHIVTKDEYTDIKNNVRQMFGDAAYVQEMNFDEAENSRFYKKMILQESLVILIAGINMLILLVYLILTQRDKIQIYFRCGITKLKIHFIFMLQWLFMIAPVYLFVLILYDSVIKEALSSVYPYVPSCMDGMVYLVISLLFFAVLIVFGVFAIGGRLLKQMRRERMAR